MEGLKKIKEKVKSKKISFLEKERLVYQLCRERKSKPTAAIAREIGLHRNLIYKYFYAYKVRKQLNAKKYDVISSRILYGIRDHPLREIRNVLNRRISKHIKANIILERESTNKEILSLKYIDNKLNVFQNITFDVLNRLRSNSIKKFPKPALEECRAYLFTIIRHCKRTLEELNPSNMRGVIIDIN